MHRIGYIVILFVLFGCTKENDANQNVVSGFYRGDNDSVFVELGALQSDGVFIPSQNDLVRISADGNLYSLTNKGNGIYHLDQEIPEEAFELTLLVNDDIRAVSLVPPSISATSSGNTELVVDPNSLGEELFGLTWNDVEGYSYVLQLECLEDVKVEIPFTVPHGLFDTQFNGPIEESSIDLYDLDFTYYGQHKLTVYVIDSKYSELFFYRSRSKRNVITAGPDNVIGANGFWACTRAFEILLNVQ